MTPEKQAVLDTIDLLRDWVQQIPDAKTTELQLIYLQVYAAERRAFYERF